MADQDQIQEKLIQTYLRLLDSYYSGVSAFVVFKTIREEYRKCHPKEDDIFIGTVVISTLNTIILLLTNALKPDSSSIDLSYLFNCIFQSKNVMDKKTYEKLCLFIVEYKAELGKLAPLTDRIIGLRDKSVAHLDRKHVNNPQDLLEKLSIKWEEIELVYDLVGSGLLKIGEYLGLSTDYYSLSVLANYALAEKTKLVYEVLSRNISEGQPMRDLYGELMKLNGRKCFTLTQNKPATMYVDDWKVTIVYPTGNTLELPRSMIMESIHKLQSNSVLTLEEVHEEITNRRGPQTDRLLAVLRELPGVTFTSSPRALYLRPE